MILLLPEELLNNILIHLEWYLLLNKYKLISSQIKRMITNNYENKLKHKLYYRCNLYLNLHLYDSDTCDSLFSENEIIFFKKYICYKMNLKN